MRIHPLLSALLLWLCCAALPVQAAEPAGEVVSMTGVLTAELDGAQRELEAGDTVHVGERLRTGRRSSALVRLLDETEFALAAEAELLIQTLVYGQSPEDDSLSARVLKGAFRFVSGLIAESKPAAMRVEAGAVATIGIRGTSVGGEVEGERATVVLLEQEKAGPNAIRVFNDFGSVDIDEAGFGTVIPDASSPPSPPQRMRLRTLDNLLRNLRATQRLAPMPGFR